MGHFNAPLDPSARHHYVGFAAGGGITPLLSIVKSTLAVRAALALHAVLRQPGVGHGDVPRRTRAALKDRHSTGSTSSHVLSREAQDIELLHGRIDRARADALLDAGCRSARSTRCSSAPRGHDGRGDPRRSEARLSGVEGEDRALRGEHQTRAPARARAPGGAADRGDGRHRRRRKSHYTLDRTRRTCSTRRWRTASSCHYSCKGGVCSTCRCRLVEGRSTWTSAFALEDYEVARASCSRARAIRRPTRWSSTSTRRAWADVAERTARTVTPRPTVLSLLEEPAPFSGAAVSHPRCSTSTARRSTARSRRSPSAATGRRILSRRGRRSTAKARRRRARPPTRRCL